MENNQRAAKDCRTILEGTKMQREKRVNKCRAMRDSSSPAWQPPASVRSGLGRGINKVEEWCCVVLSLPGRPLFLTHTTHPPASQGPISDRPAAVLPSPLVSGGELLPSTPSHGQIGKRPSWPLVGRMSPEPRTLYALPWWLCRLLVAWSGLNRSHSVCVYQ